MVGVIAVIGLSGRGPAGGVFEAAGFLRGVGIAAMVLGALASAYRQVANKKFFTNNPNARLAALKFGYLLAFASLVFPTLVMHVLLEAEGFFLVLHPLLITDFQTRCLTFGPAVSANSTICNCAQSTTTVCSTVRTWW